MVYMFSGPDRTGKDTQIVNLKKYLEEQGKLVHVLHYSAIKGDNIEARSNMYYHEMFKIIKFAVYNDINLILNRAHDGEVVYGPIYRNYDGKYIYEIEESFGNRVLNQCILFVFTADPSELIKRDDGLSFTTEVEKKKIEIDKFVEFYNDTHIKNKLLINITGKGIDEVFEEIKCHIHKMQKL